MTEDKAMSEADKALEQLVANCNHTEWNDILDDLLLRINEAVFDNELPINRIKIVINKLGGKKCGARMQPYHLPGVKKFYYKITMFLKRLEQCSLLENVQTLEHECLHIYLHSKGIRNKDKDRAFIYQAGKRDIILGFKEHIK